MPYDECKHTPFPSHQNKEEGYIPGTCNIGKAELEKRKQAAIFSAVLTIICIILIQWFDVDRLWRLLIFIPAVSFAVSFQQWYFKFCVAFGIKGVFNYGNKTLGVLDFKKKTFYTLTDEQKINFKKDRAKAISMIVTGILIGVGIAVFYFLLPV